MSLCFTKASFMMVGRLLGSAPGPYFINSAEILSYQADRLLFNFVTLFITSSLVIGESSFHGFPSKGSNFSALSSLN